MRLMPFTSSGKETFLGKRPPGRKYLVGSLVLSALAIRMLLAQRKQAEAELKAIEWLLREGGRAVPHAKAAALWRSD